MSIIPICGFEMDVPAGTTLASASTSAGDMAAGNYSYRITYVTRYGETTPSAVSGPVTVVPQAPALTGSVLLTNIPVRIVDYLTSRRIYRTQVGNVVPYKLVAELTDHTVSTYLDTSADLDLGVEPPTANTASSVGKIYGQLVLERPIAYATTVGVNATGIDRASAQNLPVKSEYVFVNTPVNGAGVVLPYLNVDKIGVTVTVRNSGATNSLNIYPQAIDTSIDIGAAGVPYLLANGESVSFIAESAIRWSKLFDSVAGGPPTGAAGGVLSGTYPAPSLAPTGVTAGSYPLATIQVNAGGQVTSAVAGSAVTSVSAGTGLTGGPITSTGSLSVAAELAGLNALATTGFVRRTGVATYTTAAEPVAETLGGTGLSAYQTGDVIYADAVNSLAILAKPSVVSVLEMSGAGVPSWTNKADLMTGLLIKEPVAVTSLTDVAGTYATTPSNGRLTGVNTTSAVIFDLGAYVLAVGERVLIKNQADAKQNGIYTITAGPLNSATLTRASDLDGTPANEVAIGVFTFVNEGSVNLHTSWVISGTSLTPPGTILTLNTDPLDWNIFSSAATYSAGTGLSLGGTVFSLQVPVTVPHGGTGKISVSTGSLLYGSAPNVYGEIADGTVSQVLRGGGGTGPTFGTVPNAALANSSLTVTAGTGLAGGGLVSLGGSVSLNLPSVGTAGTYGSATQVPVLTTDAQGRVTAVTNTAITAAPSGAASGDLTGTYPGPTIAALAVTAAKLNTDAVTTVKILDANVTNAKLQFSALTVNAGTGLSGGGSVSLGGSTTINMPVTGVTATSYGSATQVGTFTVDVYGRLTAAANVTISGVSPVGASLLSGNIWVGSGANVAAEVAMSGDVSITNTGVTTVNTIQSVFVRADNTGLNNLSFGNGSSNNLGIQNICIGTNAGSALASFSGFKGNNIAIGHNALASGSGTFLGNTVSLGGSSRATAEAGLALGAFSVTGAQYGISIGFSAAVQIAEGISIGHNAQIANGTNGINIGHDTSMQGIDCITVGSNVVNNGVYCTVVGHDSQPGRSGNSVFVGRQAGHLTALTSYGNRTIAVGNNTLNSCVAPNDSIAIGDRALRVAANSTYAVGTVAASGGIVTGTGTTFTPDMVGGLIIISGTVINEITIYTSPTQISINSGVVVAAGASYIIHYRAVRNVAIGSSALTSLTTGYHNTLVGALSGQVATTAIGNTIMGYFAGNTLTTGSRNIIFGNSADVGADSVSAIVIGNSAKNGTSSATDNILVGNNSGNLTMTQGDNIAIGSSTLASLTNGYRHVLIGTRAGTSLTTATHNILVGYETGLNITQGFENVGIGSWTLEDHVSGSGNVAVGHDAMNRNATAVDCTAVGRQALSRGFLGDRNTGVGSEALRQTEGNNNTSLGYQAGRNISTGTQNLALGQGSGLALTTGIQNVLVGAGTNCAATTTNSVVLGFGVSATASDEIVVGNSSHRQFSLGGTDAIPSIPVPNNYYAQQAGVKVGGFYRSQFNGALTTVTNAITSSFVGTGTTLTVTAVGAATLAVGQVLTAGVGLFLGPPAIYIVAQLTGAAGDVGTYQVSLSQTAGTTVTQVTSSSTSPDIVYMRTV